MSSKAPPGAQAFFDSLTSDQRVALAKLSKLSDKDQGEAGRFLISAAAKSPKPLPGSTLETPTGRKLEAMAQVAIRCEMYSEPILNTTRAAILELPEAERESAAVLHMFRFLERLAVLFGCTEASRR